MIEEEQTEGINKCKRQKQRNAKKINSDIIRETKKVLLCNQRQIGHSCSSSPPWCNPWEKGWSITIPIKIEKTTNNKKNALFFICTLNTILIYTKN